MTGLGQAVAGPDRWQSLVAASADIGRYEMVDGSVIATPPPDPRHQLLADEITAVLRAAAPHGFAPLRSAALRVPAATLIPDIMVLRPAASLDAPWISAVDVALVVEVEAAGTWRFDRHVKPCLYAEAGIDAYWRIECTDGGPVAHLYGRANSHGYASHRSVNPGQTVLAELPFEVQVAPRLWA